MSFDPKKERFLHALQAGKNAVPSIPSSQAIPVLKSSAIAPIGAPQPKAIAHPRPFGMLHDYLTPKVPHKVTPDEEQP